MILILWETSAITKEKNSNKAKLKPHLQQCFKRDKTNLMLFSKGIARLGWLSKCSLKMSHKVEFGPFLFTVLCRIIDLRKTC